MVRRLDHALTAAVLKLLRPLVRILLRNGVSYGAFADMAKRVYVEVATDEFAIAGRKQSISRVSTITGLTRKEVSRVQKLPDPRGADAIEQRYNRAARVISGWVRDRRFADRGGRPAALRLKGDGATFGELVKRYSGDMPARAVLDELLRVGAVERGRDGRVALLARAYVPSAGETDKLAILGREVYHLISTIDHNLSASADETDQAGGPRFQRTVAYDNLPAEALPALRSLSAERAQRLLEQMDRWLSQRDRDVKPAASGTGRKRAGIGIYYFEEDFVEED